MATNLQTNPGQGVGDLVSGIVQDAQELVGQQFTLFKQEVRQDFRKAKDAAGVLGAAVGILTVGSVLLGVMLVHLLFDLAAGHLPMWACYGIVGGVLALVGGALARLAFTRLGDINPLPEKTAKAMEENLEWKTKPN